MLVLILKVDSLKFVVCYDIIANCDFKYRSPNGLLNNIRYNVGNPMELYIFGHCLAMSSLLINGYYRESGISWILVIY
jgi:hypothetical protein